MCGGASSTYKPDHFRGGSGFCRDQAPSCIKSKGRDPGEEFNGNLKSHSKHTHTPLNNSFQSPQVWIWQDKCRRVQECTFTNSWMRHYIDYIINILESGVFGYRFGNYSTPPPPTPTPHCFFLPQTAPVFVISKFTAPSFHGCIAFKSVCENMLDL